ncbi:MAG: peptidoglycan DD-metalloendopeptidase family protein [Chloroflexi bacterium]|nr:peptidoglycan DD-metalloendopeptidase family protein [Chloroflexota bacterium]
MSWLKDTLHGKRAVDAIPQRPVFPTWSLGEYLWHRIRLWIEVAPRSQEILDISRRLTTHLALLTGVLFVLLLVRLGVIFPPTKSAAMMVDVPVASTAETDSVVPTAPAHAISQPTPVVVLPAAVGTLAPAPVLSRRPIPHTETVERPRRTIVYYEVQPGDTVWKIAKKFGLKPKTVEWANSLELNPDLLRVGQKLVIPPVDGVIHIVEPGDTLERLARKYKVKPEDIVAYEPNGLKSVDDTLAVGKTLIIPGGIKPVVRPTVRMYSGPVQKQKKPVVHGTGNFVWPATGRLTSLFGQIVCSPMYGCRPHMGIDIAAPIGTPVVASDAGYVVFAGWDKTGYGKIIVLDHGNGFTTVYAHLHSILVRKGQTVARGQRIGSVGKTGNTTGPHLHFEIRQRGHQRNPLGFLPSP